jgi:hypothetical protein
MNWIDLVVVVVVVYFHASLQTICLWAKVQLISEVYYYYYRCYCCPSCHHRHRRGWYNGIILIALIIRIIRNHNIEDWLSAWILINHLKPKLVLIIFNYSIHTSKKTQHFTITKIKWLIVFMEIIAVYYENYMKLINAELFIAKAGDSHIYHYNLKGQ